MKFYTMCHDIIILMLKRWHIIASFSEILDNSNEETIELNAVVFILKEKTSLQSLNDWLENKQLHLDHQPKFLKQLRVSDIAIMKAVLNCDSQIRLSSAQKKNHTHLLYLIHLLHRSKLKMLLNISHHVTSPISISRCHLSALPLPLFLTLFQMKNKH